MILRNIVVLRSEKNMLITQANRVIATGMDRSRLQEVFNDAVLAVPDKKIDRLKSVSVDVDMFGGLELETHNLCPLTGLTNHSLYKLRGRDYRLGQLIEELLRIEFDQPIGLTRFGVSASEIFDIAMLEINSSCEVESSKGVVRVTRVR
jgi:hypothetical protein